MPWTMVICIRRYVMSSRTPVLEPLRHIFSAKLWIIVRNIATYCINWTKAYLSIFRVNMPICENRSVIVSRKCQMKRAAYATWFDEFFYGKRSSIWIDDGGVCHDPCCMFRGRCKNNCSSVHEIPPIKYYSPFLVPILLPLVGAALNSAVKDWATIFLDTVSMILN